MTRRHTTHRSAPGRPVAGGRRPGRLTGLGLTTLALLTLAGCRSTLDMSRLMPGGGDDEIERLADTGDIRGPLERVLQTSSSSAAPRPVDGDRDYEKAVALYREKSYRKAEKEFKRLAKEYKHTPVGEDAQFMLGESRFERKRYSWAQDSYDQLLKDYPSSRHIEVVTRRMFHIAQTWLQTPEMVTSSDIQQVNFDDPASTPPLKEQPKKSSDPTRRVPILPNVTDRSRPVFDTDGRALQALKSIWLHDPTGELADDAIMMSASYHLRRGDYAEANRFYTLLREEFPKSPHLEQAFVLGSHVELMSYQGPNYDGGNLDRARQLKDSTLRIYPDNPNSDRLRDELRKLDEAEARHDWAMVRFYWKKNNTTWADRARQVLAGASPKEAEQGRQATRVASRPEPSRPRGVISPGVPAAAPEKAPAESGSRFRIPRLLPRLPSLRPIFGGGKSAEDETESTPGADAGSAEAQETTDDSPSRVSTGGLLPRLRLPSFGAGKADEEPADQTPSETYAPGESPGADNTGRVRL